MRRSRILSTLVALLVTSAVMAGCGNSNSNSSGGSSSASGSSRPPIVIGAVIDLSSALKAYDGPALKAAELEANKINAAGGVDGRKIVFRVENDQLNPQQTRADALDMVSKGANILWVNCDVDWATPAIEVALSKGLLAVAPCISTDQMGPKRFGPIGKLAFTFGSIAQDEGAALAQVAIQHGWKTADVVTDKAIAYTIDDAQAFIKRFTQLGGKIVAQDSFVEGDHTIGSAASHVVSQKAQVIELSEFWSPAGDMPTFLSDVRSVGDTTPILGPWSLDGKFWLPNDPKISTNIWHTSYSSVYGDDPDPAVAQLQAEMTAAGDAPASGGFVLGAAAIEAIVKAIKQAGGSTDGAQLASIIENYHGLNLTGGPVTFTSQIHGVFGRPWRLIQVMGGKPRFLGMVKATSPAGF